MKLLILILSLNILSFSLNAQAKNCNLKIVTDKLANTKIAYTPVWSATNGLNKMDLTFYKTGQLVVLAIVLRSEQIFCVDNSSSAVIKFSDDSSLELKATNIGNCTGSFQSAISTNNPPAGTEALALKNVTSIVVESKSGSLSFTENAADAKQIMHYYKCITSHQF